MIDKIKITVTKKYNEYAGAAVTRYKGYTDNLFKRYILGLQFDKAAKLHKYMVKDSIFINDMIKSLIVNNKLIEAAFVEKSFKLKEKVLEYRQQADFDLIKHMKSIRETKPGKQPSCNCLICKNLYKAQQNKQTYLSTVRIINSVRKRLQVEENIMSDPTISEEKRSMILSRFEENIPILNKTQYSRYIGFLSRIARSSKINHQKHMQIATKLMGLLRVPNN